MKAISVEITNYFFKQFKYKREQRKFIDLNGIKGQQSREYLLYRLNVRNLH